MARATLEDARAAKEKLRALLVGYDAVNAIGITADADGHAVKVNLRRPLTENETIPDEVDGVPVKTELVGKIRKRIE